MNQSRINRVKGVEKITENGAMLAKESVQNCQQRLDEQQARLVQLSDYLQEYAAGLGFATGGSSQAFALQNYRAFMGKIEQTIAHQKTVVAQIQAELIACQNCGGGLKRSTTALKINKNKSLMMQTPRNGTITRWVFNQRSVLYGDFNSCAGARFCRRQ
ncbi:MAG: hypothetical protein B7Y53_06105 [Halothiobacillus sp. 28-55-5]|nr:MAG: hypothetical protein B7Y53_06105 [Halothiobacillus sp. 28-55-5]